MLMFRLPDIPLFPVLEPDIVLRSAPADKIGGVVQNVFDSCGRAHLHFFAAILPVMIAVGPPAGL
jgi:hypothetical protein